MDAPFPYFHVSSEDAYERGRQLGTATAEYVKGSVDVYRETFEHYTGLPWSDIRELAGEFREPIANYDESIMREIEGIAAGSALPVEDVLAVNARTEIMFGLAAKDKNIPSECTSFYIGRSATADGHVLVGQNWDWRPRCAETTILAEVDQPGRPSFVMLAEGGLVGKLGFNSAGIGVAANALVSGLDKGARDVPFHIILRGILNAETIEEAVAAVIRSKRAASANYVIASARGVAVNLETAPGGIETAFLVHPTNDLIWHSNNFTCDITFEDVGGQKWLDSPIRIREMGSNLEQHRATLTRESMTELLKDHTNYPDSICRHPNENEPEVERASSVASWVIDLTDLVASICTGPPCSSEFTTFAPEFSRVVASVA